MIEKPCDRFPDFKWIHLLIAPTVYEVLNAWSTSGDADQRTAESPVYNEFAEYSKFIDEIVGEEENNDNFTDALKNQVIVNAIANIKAILAKTNQQPAQ